MTTSNVVDASRQNGQEKTPEEIQLEIARTRSAITEDLLALSEKLSPQNLRESAREVMRDAREEAKEVLREAKDAAFDSLRDMKERAVETVTEKVTEIGHTAKQTALRATDVTTTFVSANSLALSLLGVGAGFLLVLLRSRRQRLSSGEFDYHYERYGAFPEETRYEDEQREQAGLRSRVRSMASDASEALDSARERVRHASHETRERAGQLAHRSGDSLRRGAARTREVASDHRGAVIALTVAAGLGLGLLLPVNGRPRRALLSRGERLWDDAQSLGRSVGRRMRREPRGYYDADELAYGAE